MMKLKVCEKCQKELAESADGAVGTMNILIALKNGMFETVESKDCQRCQAKRKAGGT